MRYASAVAFRRALETRLLEHSRQTGLSLVRLRKSVVFSRLLARLIALSPDRWVLKGGLALDYRLGIRVRSTKDMDLTRQDGEEAATADLIAAQATDLGDDFTFVIERTGRLDEVEGANAVRYHVRSILAGRVFEEVVVDVGFDHPSPDWQPDVVRGPDLLGFAGIAPVDAPTIPVELQIAEKVHAYTRTYGSSDTGSSRVKDLIDIVLIGSAVPMDAALLWRALRETFERRRQHGLPAALPPPPLDWRVPYRRLASEVGLDGDLASGYRHAAALLDPILAGDARSGRWDLGRQAWGP